MQWKPEMKRHFPYLKPLMLVISKSTAWNQAFSMLISQSCAIMLFHWMRYATGSISNFLKSSCEGAKRPKGGGGWEGGVPPPTVWSFFVFQCGIVCSGAYFRGYFHIFLHIISVFNWVLGTYCHIVIKKKKKKSSLFLEISGNPEISGNVTSLLNANKAGSMGKRTIWNLEPTQSSVRLPIQPTLFAFSATAYGKGTAETALKH